MRVGSDVMNMGSKLGVNVLFRQTLVVSACFPGFGRSGQWGLQLGWTRTVPAYSCIVEAGFDLRTLFCGSV